jgi:hypothetical protein
MSIGIFLLMSACLFMELSRFLAWLIRRVISALSLNSGTKKVPKYLNLVQKDTKRYMVQSLLLVAFILTEDEDEDLLESLLNEAISRG